MMLVTYLPRLLPMLFLTGRRVPRRLSRLFSSIPFAAMGALIIPGGIYAVEGNIPASVVGLAVAALAAWFVKSIIAAVLTSIAAVFLVITLF